jgi:hypothetical protein
MMSANEADPMSLTLTEFGPVKQPIRRRWVWVVAIMGTLIALGGWQLVSAVRRVRVAASRLTDT